MKTLYAVCSSGNTKSIIVEVFESYSDADDFAERCIAYQCEKPTKRGTLFDLWEERHPAGDRRNEHYWVEDAPFRRNE